MKVPRSFSYINNALYIQNTHNFPFIQHHRARLTLMPFDSSSTVCIWFFLCCVFFFFRFFCCFFGYIFTFISLLLRKCVFFSLFFVSSTISSFGLCFCANTIVHFHLRWQPFWSVDLFHFGFFFVLQLKHKIPWCVCGVCHKICFSIFIFFAAFLELHRGFYAYGVCVCVRDIKRVNTHTLCVRII